MKITKNIISYSLLAGIFLVPFIAFFVPSAMYFPFIAGKGFMFRILIEILFGMYVFLAFVDPLYRPKFSWITKSIALFAFVILIADLLGANAYKSLWSNYERMEGFVLIFHLLLYYIVASGTLRTVSRWNQFWNTSIVASVLMSIYGLLQLMGKVAINQGGVRLDATFGNSSYLAIYLVFHIFLCLYMLVDVQKPKWQKWLYAAAAVFETCILYFTATRGAIIGLILGLLLSAVIVAIKERENKTLRRSAQYLLGGVLVILLGFFALRHASFVQKSPVLSRFATMSLSEVKTQGRYFVWPMALKGIAERPILGWGQENFNFVFNKFYNPAMYGQEQWFDRTHNIVLDWMINGGILGFLAYVSMYVALFYYIWRRESLMTLSEKSILTGMIVAYIFHNMFVFDNLISYVVFFSLLAYVHAVSVMRKEPVGAFETRLVSPDITNYLVLPLTVIAVIASVYFVNVPAINANRTLIQAITPQQTGGIDTNLALFKQTFAYNSFGSSEALEQLVQIASQIASATSDQVSDASKQAFYVFTKDQIEQKIAKTPNDARYLVFAGSFFNRFSQYDTAIEYLNRAVAASPGKQTIYFELGTSYLGKRDYPNALKTFKTAYDLDPNVQDSKLIYAIGALYNQNGPLVKELLTGIDPALIIGDNRFLRAYADLGDYQSVIFILQARLAKDPTNMQYKLSLASAYATMGDKAHAIAVLRDMIAQDPTFKAQGESYIQQIQNGK